MSTEAPIRRGEPFTGVLASAGQALLAACLIIGGLFVLQWRILRAMVPPAFDYDETLRQFYKVGVQSVTVVVATSFFVGAIMVISTGHFVAKTGATAIVGWGAGTAVLSEVGPVLIGLMFSGRVGANNTAELGTMTITEQVAALRVLGIDPVRYLVVPRFIAMIVMLVLLTCVGDLFALFGGSLVSHLILNLDMRLFWQAIVDNHMRDEFLMGLVKGFAFGGAISLVSCHWGLRVDGGAEGVGRAVNNSVVTSAVMIFVVNFFVTMLWVQ